MAADPRSQLQSARAVARLLDEAVRIPGTGITIGLDPLLGLVPGLGDVVGGALSGYVVLAAVRLGASPAVVARMLGNIAMDSVVGAVPVLGDLFDVGWKSNVRNVALLEAHVARPDAVRRGSGLLLAAVVVALVALVVLAVAGGVALTRLLLRSLH